MKFYSFATIMTITASAAHAATKVSGEDHDAIVTGLRQLTTNSGSDKLGDFLSELIEGVLEKKWEEPVTTTVATPVSMATAKSGKALGGSGKSGKDSNMPSSVLNGSPVLVSDESGAIVPLLNQCFASRGGKGYPCSYQQALGAAFLDKDADSRLDGEQRIIFNQINDPAGITFLKCNDGICESGTTVNLGVMRRGQFYSGEVCFFNDFNVPGTCDANSGDNAGDNCFNDCECDPSCSGGCIRVRVEEPCDDYLLYCCSDQPQFNEAVAQ